MRFENKVVIVTGAASGIGFATAMRFAEEGACLVLVDRNSEQLHKAKKKITQKFSSSVSLFCFDISREGEVKECINNVVRDLGSIDVLFNNAGVLDELETIDAQNVENWNKVISVNLIGSMLLIKHCSKVMMEKGDGAIINTASVAGIRAGAGTNAYSSSKAAVISLTQTAACDLGSYGIRVNAICPGLIETGMTKPVFDYAKDKGKEDKLGSRCELRRYGRPEEVASVVAFLASSDASYITGQALPVDGGNTASLNLPGMKF